VEAVSPAIPSFYAAMKKRLATLSLVCLVSIAAIALALLSVNVERIGPELVQDGNLCGPHGNDPCYKPALKGGFPFAYLFDQPGISVPGRLSFFEDTLFVWPLVLDIAVYLAAVLLVSRLASRLRPASPGANAKTESDPAEYQAGVHAPETEAV
jgi:hypothetical protein